MTKDEFRRDLNRLFDDMSGSPSSALSDRVRSSVARAPRAREPYWLAGVAAAVIAVVIVGVLVVANPLKRPPSPIGGVNASPTSSATTSPAAQPTPSASPFSEQFACTSGVVQSPVQGPQPAVAYIDALRTGTHQGYDRLTIEFANGTASQLDVRVQNGTAFTLSPSGLPTTLKGKNGILLVIHGADLHTDYRGSTDIVTGYAGLAEVKRVEDFEGVVQLGLGVNGAACYHAVWLTNPNRLVIDVQAG